jgi:hypothetical protein
MCSLYLQYTALHTLEITLTSDIIITIYILLLNSKFQPDIVWFIIME